VIRKVQSTGPSFPHWQTLNQHQRRCLDAHSIVAYSLFSAENESITPAISKAEREQEIHKYYRAELIQHLTSWPSNQLEKQVE
jgi:hypothetical protein